ncbi:hypothetical protein ACET3Z_020813 [Daucus carota]
MRKTYSKMDKASVPRDVIKYLKQLQERVKALEEQTRRSPQNQLLLPTIHPQIITQLAFLLKSPCQKLK